MKREEQNGKKTQCSNPADMCADSRINTDPNGMWTGVPTDTLDELPVQDVDDL